MLINWNAIATISAPIIALFIGVWVNRRFENRPVLISYLGHVSVFRHQPQPGNVMQVHTHSVILRNAGRRSATNVRLRHNTLPDFNIWPEIQHHVEDLPTGGREIVIPTLIPGEQITISYLYFPPTTIDQINAGIRCDQGFARPIPVLLQRQYPRWVSLIAAILLVIGLISVVYSLYNVMLWIIGHVS
ncbi:MAG: hypothetical protein ACYDBV_11550 [Nitrospiria bacterium]